MKDKTSLFKLFWIFFKISCVLFGGGYAILPFLKSEIAEKEKICTIEEIADYYAISQCFPGLVAGNISILIGYKSRGTLGAITCLTGVCLPAFLAIAIIFAFLSTITDTPIVQEIFKVLDVAICVLIFLTVGELWSRSITNKFTTTVFILALVAAIFDVSPFIIVISAAILGIAKNLISQKLGKKGEQNA